MKVYGNSDIGCIRKVNEDNFYYGTNHSGNLLAVVCDGIGGSAAGEVASQIACSTLQEAFEENPDLDKDFKVRDWISEKLHLANDKIYKKSLENPMVRGMGTTCVGCIITSTGSYIFNVGDSRIYALYHEGLVQMSEDHSVIQQLIKEGKIDKEQAKTHAKRNTLTNALGVWHVFRIDINKIQSNYRALLLCSDGLHGYVNHEQIEAIVKNDVLSLEEKVNHLISIANQLGGYDNCTIILIDPLQEDIVCR